VNSKGFDNSFSCFFSTTFPVPVPDTALIVRNRKKKTALVPKRRHIITVVVSIEDVLILKYNNVSTNCCNTLVQVIDGKVIEYEILKNYYQVYLYI